MYSILTDHHTISFSTSMVIVILGLLLLAIKVPHAIEWRSLKQVRVYLAVSYFILGVSGFVSSYIEADPDATILDLERVIILIVGSFQALLFTVTNLVFVRSSYVNRRNVILNVASIILVGIVLFLSFFYLPNLFSITLYIAVGGYCCQLLYYFRLFRKEYKECVQRLEEHYEEDEEERLHWIRNCFYSALCIGILAMLSVTFAITVAIFDTFVLLYTLYYAYVVSTVYNYRTEALFLIQAIGKDVVTKEAIEGNKSKLEIELPVEAKQKAKQSVEELSIEELTFEGALARWEKNKRYLEMDVSIAETEAELGVSRNFLRSYFSTRKSVNFRTWKLELRMQEAKRILRDDPSVPVSYLYEVLGFTDRSNFHRHFIRFVGQTPTEYRNSHN